MKLSDLIWPLLLTIGFCSSVCGQQVASSYAPSKWVHPGISNTIGELNEIKLRVKNNIQPQKSAWVELLKGKSTDGTCSSLAELTYQDHATAIVNIDKKDINYGGITCDGSAMYSLALRWYISGDERYAIKCIEVMNNWSAKLKTIQTKPGSGTFATQHKLVASWVVTNFAEAAEIIVHTYPKWKTNGFDFKGYQRMLAEVFYPLLKNGAGENGNWEASFIQGILSMSILLEDAEMFHRGISMAKNEGSYGTGRGSIPKYICSITGQCQEVCRDSAHPQMGIGALVRAAEMAKNQGVNLYDSFPDENNVPRIAKGLIYIAELLQGIEKNTDDGCAAEFMKSHASPCATLNWADRGASSIWAYANNHYNTRMGYNYAAIQWVVDHKIPIESVGKLGQFAWGTLTHGLLGNK